MSWGMNGPLPAQFREPVGIAVDHIGNVYVPDHINNRVSKFTNDGILSRLGAL
jgi:hypothetical protein